MTLSLHLEVKGSGCVLKEHNYLESNITSTQKPTTPTFGVLQVMLTGYITTWWVCAAKQNK